MLIFKFILVVVFLYVLYLTGKDIDRLLLGIRVPDPVHTVLGVEVLAVIIISLFLGMTISSIGNDLRGNLKDRVEDLYLQEENYNEI